MAPLILRVWPFSKHGISWKKASSSCMHFRPSDATAFPLPAGAERSPASHGARSNPVALPSHAAHSQCRGAAGIGEHGDESRELPPATGKGPPAERQERRQQGRRGAIGRRTARLEPVWAGSIRGSALVSTESGIQSWRRRQLLARYSLTCYSGYSMDFEGLF